VETAQEIREPGKNIGRDLRTAEKLEADLDALIERRHNQRVATEGERPAEEAWLESERLHIAARRA
jgi:hypothetical protein